ncbi:carbohydrate esterase family 1 protein [Aplosporella prunicola CBS 121167]|uniref:Feruloyl esterase C n=1 Tax=Aplosporella prunicola CBS 121167 TaxID=1176127 RepID=A0A6A6BIC5_9PEZI|nr:carbohydrate esterase family 1 protein [Aplosporella prunicola CBS 121167]KAF2143173.1 carbohydrate esterase family 1 protein [Aplosporella prunicola CBS 121167]
MTRWSSTTTAALAALTFSSLPTALAATKSPGCGKEATMTSPNAYNLTINEKTRYYYLNVPENYDNSHAYKLIFTFHALGGTAFQVRGGIGEYLPWYGLPEQDTNNSAIYIAPDGLNTNGMTGWPNEGGEDLALVDKIIKTVEADLCIDQEHRYSTGFSYGGAMSGAIACDRADDFKAVAVLSGAELSGCENGTTPIPYYGQHGVNDTVLPPELGRELRDKFVKNNGCDAAEPEEPDIGSGIHIRTEYKNCDYPVTWVAFDGPHSAKYTDVGVEKSFSPEETWRFFEKFPQEA